MNQGERARQYIGREVLALATPALVANAEALDANVPAWHDHWHYAMDKTIILDAPAEKIRVRYVGKPGVNGIRVNLHSIRPDEKISHAVVATLRYRMGGKEVIKTFNFDKPTKYTIDCPRKPENVYDRIQVPSDAQPGR